jgi:tRNA pseudouridine38-40 synthase
VSLNKAIRVNLKSALNTFAANKQFLRYFLRLSYSGGPFHGWQIQPNALAVQAVVNEQLSTLFQEPVNVVGAGRTDAGVHAKEMYAHLDLTKPIENPALALNRLNKMLGKAIAAHAFIPVSPQAHARFDAQSRSYQYYIHQQKDPFKVGFSAYWRYPLSESKMQEAAKLLVGERDYRAFSKSKTQTHTNICNISKACWEHDGHQWVFHITANRFLRNMVRAIVGTMLQIGRGRMEPGFITDIIESKDRRRAGESAPAEGLYLTKITYPKKILNGRFG